MAKRICCVLLALMLAVGTLPRAAAAPVEVKAPSALLMEASTGKILFEQDSHARLAPASVTKIMTLLLVMEALDAGKIGWNDTVTASAAAVNKGGSQVYLKEGEQMPLADMVKSVAVASANDCATALAELVAGSESAFVDLMNARAAELGMADTHFVNCTGLDDAPEAAEHLTSAADIAIMSRELLRHDEIRKYTTIWMDTVRDGQFGLSNTNKLVRFYEGTTGLKTGFTSGAGYCLSASALRGGMELIAVVLHCATSPDRFESAKALLSYGFANYALLNPQPEAPLAPIPVILGASAAVTPALGDVTPILMDKGQIAGAEKTVALAENVEAPVEQGQRLGTMTVTAGGKTVAEIPLVAQDAVPRLSWWQVTMQIFSGVCTAR